MDRYMKIKSIINEIIKEGKQVGIVYHFTTLNNAIMIVKSNHLKAYRATKNINGRTLSTSRDKNFSKRRGDQLSISGADIAFVLDGNKLSNTYQVRPYDDTYDATEREYEPEDKLNFGDEQEEIWYGKKIESDVGFKNFNKYVIKVIFTKRFIDKCFFKPAKLYVVGEDKVTDLFGSSDEFELEPRKKINEIKDWFENNGFKVEIEK